MLKRAMATNERPEMERRDPELQLKEEVCGVFNSSTIYESMQGDWRVSRVDDFEVGKPLIRSEIPLNATDFKDFDRDMVEELTVKSYKGGGQHKPIRFLGDSLTRARDQLMMNARDNSGRGNLDILAHRRSVDKHGHQEDEDSCEMTSTKKIISGSTVIASNPALRVLSSSGFSSFFKSRNVKGKEVVGGCPMNRNAITSDASFEHGAIIKQLPQNCTDGFAFDLHQGISLREWLKHGCFVMNNIERLSLFRKIVEVVNNAHSQGVVLLNLCPSSFNLLPFNRVQYIGSSSRVAPDIPNSCKMSRKRRLEHDIHGFSMSGAKQQKVVKDNSQYEQALVTSRCESEFGTDVEGSNNLAYAFQITGRPQNSLEADFLSEEKWYTCPEQLPQKSCTTSSSNIYRLGLLAFEMLCSFDSLDALSVAMLDVHQRIFPPIFLSENPKEAAFIMWLLHPEPSLRPTTREILLSDLIGKSESEELSSNSELPSTGCHDNMEKELLMEFLVSLKEEEKTASKLVEDITFLEADIKEAERRHLSRTSSRFCPAISSCKREARLVGDLSQLEKAYFSMRSQSQTTVPEEIVRSDRGMLKHTERVSQLQTPSECVTVNQKSNDRLKVFFEGLCKFTCYSGFEVCGTVRNGELLNSNGAICALSFDRDEDYIAAAGVSRKIKIFDLAAFHGTATSETIWLQPIMTVLSRFGMQALE